MSLFSRIRRAMMLTCKDTNQFLAEYHDDVLDERTRRRFEKHVGSCSECQAYLGQYETTVQLVGDEGRARADPPEELVSLTLDFLRKHYGSAVVRSAVNLGT